MPIIEGLIDPQGNLVRRRGTFTVVAKANHHLEIECTGEDVSQAFVLATAWRSDGDIGTSNAAVAASPNPGKPANLLFAVDNYYGLSFRVDNDPAAGATAAEIQTRGWYAWVNLMPPGPIQLHVVGEVFVPHLGIDPLLLPHDPQGTDPTTLLLDLHLLELPGIWPQVFAWKPVRFDRVVVSNSYQRVQILSGQTTLADVAVAEIS